MNVKTAKTEEVEKRAEREGDCSKHKLSPRIEVAYICIRILQK